jgi:pyruvate dehydrogenase kinase 2/3/4
MREIVRRCQDRNYNSNLYCHRQLPIILAHIVRMLDTFPAGLSAMRSIAEVRQKYVDCFDLLLSVDQPLCDRTERAFHAALEKIEEELQQLDVLKTVATGILELKEHLHRHRLALIHLKNTTERWKALKIPSDSAAVQNLQQLQGPLDDFNRQYVYYNFLSRQLLGLVAAKPASQDMIGIVDKEVDLFEVVKYAVSDACQICTSAYGDNPDVLFEFPPQSLRSHKFMHMGSTITYIVVELMKNALRATIENNMKRNENGIIDCGSMPPVKVLVNVPPTAEHACVCISDEGGGIPRTKLEAVMSYTFTTAAVPALQPVKNNRGTPAITPAAEDADSRLARTAVMAGYGYGLPMSRVYARCFGGDICIQSVEGYGTKVYYYLKLS